jgi:exosortase
MGATLVPHLTFAVLWSLSLAAFHTPLNALLQLSLHDSRYSHIAFVPLLSAVLIYYERKRIFEHSRRCLPVAVPVLSLGAACYWMAVVRSVAWSGALWLIALGIALIWVAVFIACYGLTALRAAGFAFGLLLFAIPIPAALLEGVNSVLQRGSAEVTHVLLRLAGVPVLRNDMRFSLPGLEIEVAEQCSGVRSAFALVITGLVAGQMLLRTSWARIALAMLTVPIAIFKNGIRIATISWLTSYVDEGIIHSALHRRGGLPFSLLALAMLLVAIFLFRKAEAGRTGGVTGERETSAAPAEALSLK